MQHRSPHPPDGLGHDDLHTASCLERPNSPAGRESRTPSLDQLGDAASQQRHARDFTLLKIRLNGQPSCAIGRRTQGVFPPLLIIGQTDRVDRSSKEAGFAPQPFHRLIAQVLDRQALRAFGSSEVHSDTSARFRLSRNRPRSFAETAFSPCVTPSSARRGATPPA